MAAKSSKKPVGKATVKASKKGSVKPQNKPTKAASNARVATPSRGKASTKVSSAVNRKSPPKPIPPKKKAPAKVTAISQRAPGKSALGAAKTTAKKGRPAPPPGAPRHNLIDSPFKNYTPYDPKKGEAYMSTEQLDHFRSMLLNWRQDLMEEVDRTVHHMQEEAANFPDPADRATQEEEFSIELRTRDRERRLIKKIDQTIERIDQEDYGYCDTCGVEIGLRRLEARPTASQCVDCKTLDEIKERQQLG